LLSPYSLEAGNNRAIDRFWRASDGELRAGDRDSNRVRTTVSDPFHQLVTDGVPEAVPAGAPPRSREVIAGTVGRERLKQRGAIVNIDIDRTIGAIGVPGPAFDVITVGKIMVTVIRGERCDFGCGRLLGAGIAERKARRVATQVRRKWRAAPHIRDGVAIDQFVRGSCWTLERVLFREVQTIVLYQNPGGVVRFDLIQPRLPRRPDQGRACGIGIPGALHHAGHSRLQVIGQIKAVEDTGRIAWPGVLIYIINAMIAGAEPFEQFAAAFLSNRQSSLDIQFFH